MRRRNFLIQTLSSGAGLALSAASPALAAPLEHASTTASLSRSAWLKLLERVADPVLQSAANGRLQQQMPVEASPGLQDQRRVVTYLEAVGRTLAGIAPWLALHSNNDSENQLRSRYIDWARAAIATGVDKNSPGYLRFGEDRQTIVDSGFLALALARAPKVLCDSLPTAVKSKLADAFRATRRQTPPINNWLLFAAMIEVALFLLGEEWDRQRIDVALRSHASWYLGDSVYGDGPHFHADYYDSYVIHPFLLAVLDTVGSQDPSWQAMVVVERTRAVRYAVLQERSIAPDGTFPPIGRSLAYRCGAFHLLADTALRHMLPASLAPEQVRCALSAVLHRTLGPAGTFDDNGWLQIGLAGHQPAIGESYISTGSLYLCTTAFLPLGLAASDQFWAGPSVPWTSQRVWSGSNIPADHAIDS